MQVPLYTDPGNTVAPTSREIHILRREINEVREVNNDRWSCIKVFMVCWIFLIFAGTIATILVYK